MSLVLVTREDLNNRALAHYRTKGSKNGVRLYQYEDGSLTPLGRIHYGVGLGRDRSGASVLRGKKQVNSDGSLTKTGIRNVEDSSKRGYLNPTEDDVKNGRAVERKKISDEYAEEYRKAVDNGMSKNDPSDEGRELWNKYKDRYAEATLKDLKLPVSDKNKEIVKNTFEKYDVSYDYDRPSSDPNNPDKESKERLEIQENWEKRFGKKLSEKTDKEIGKEIQEHIEGFNESTKAKKEDRAKKAKEEKARLQDEIKGIRELTDDELRKRLSRLQLEKQYAELLNERNAREKSPLHQFMQKQFMNAAQNLASKSLNMATDELLKRVRDKYSASQSKNNDADNSGSKDSGGGKNPSGSSGNSGGSSGGKFSKPEKAQIRSMAASGKSVAEIASALGVDESRVQGYMSAAGITIT